MTDDIKQTIGKALGKIPSGVFILTATHENQSAAMMVSWAIQAAFSPPAISLAVGKDRPIRKLIEAGGKIALSVVAKLDPTLMKKYARGIPEGEDPFAGMNVGQAPGGATYFADAIAWLECKTLKICDFGGDHDLFIMEITAGQILKDDAPFTHVRGNGFHY